MFDRFCEIACPHIEKIKNKKDLDIFIKGKHILYTIQYKNFLIKLYKYSLINIFLPLKTGFVYSYRGN